MQNEEEKEDEKSEDEDEEEEEVVVVGSLKVQILRSLSLDNKGFSRSFTDLQGMQGLQGMRGVGMGWLTV